MFEKVNELRPSEKGRKRERERERGEKRERKKESEQLLKEEVDTKRTTWIPEENWNVFLSLSFTHFLSFSFLLSHFLSHSIYITFHIIIEPFRYGTKNRETHFFEEWRKIIFSLSFSLYVLSFHFFPPLLSLSLTHFLDIIFSRYIFVSVENFLAEKKIKWGN